MSTTLQEILQGVGAYIDQDTTLPTGTELNVRTSFANRALRDWADAYDWKALRKPGTFTVSLSGTSAALPVDFFRLSSPIYDLSQPVSKDREYIEIDSTKRFKRQSADKVVWTGGNSLSGNYLGSFGFVNGFTPSYDYQSLPTSMATLSDVCVCPNPNFIIQKTIAYTLEARSDSRFPAAKEDANLELRKLIEAEDTPPGSQDNRIPDWPRSTGFVIGE
jgi:hypothetical protein